METKWIKKEDMQDFCMYKVDARNFSVGIWFEGKMHGLREKYGDMFIDTEFHYDDGPPYGTCKPLVKLSSSLDKGYRLHASMFDRSNWRGQSALTDILYGAEIVQNFIDQKKEDNEKV